MFKFKSSIVVILSKNVYFVKLDLDLKVLTISRNEF